MHRENSYIYCNSLTLPIILTVCQYLHLQRLELFCSFLTSLCNRELQCLLVSVEALFQITIFCTGLWKSATVNLFYFYCTILMLLNIYLYIAIIYQNIYTCLYPSAACLRYSSMKLFQFGKKM